MTKKPNFEAVTDTVKCVDFLRDRERATYLELAQHVGRDVQRRHRYVLESARRMLEREGIVFVCETNVGLVRANHVQIAKLSTEMPIEKIRRTTKRAKKREKIVDTQRLSGEDRAAFYIGRAVLGAISQATRKAFANQITHAVNTSAEPLSIGQTLSLFDKLKPARRVQ